NCLLDISQPPHSTRETGGLSTVGWDPAAGPRQLSLARRRRHDVASRCSGPHVAQSCWHLIAPKVLEPGRRQFRISNRVADITMPEVILNRSRIVAITGKLVSRTMSQHVC